MFMRRKLEFVPKVNHPIRGFVLRLKRFCIPDRGFKYRQSSLDVYTLRASLVTTHRFVCLYGRCSSAVVVKVGAFRCAWLPV